jgi:hypothetical protein
MKVSSPFVVMTCLALVATGAAAARAWPRGKDQSPSASPGPLDEKTWQRIRGTVQRVDKNKLSLATDDGRLLDVDIKQVGESMRRSLTPGETVTVVGFYRRNPTTVVARFVQKDALAEE